MFSLGTVELSCLARRGLCRYSSPAVTHERELPLFVTCGDS